MTAVATCTSETAPEFIAKFVEGLPSLDYSVFFVPDVGFFAVPNLSNGVAVDDRLIFDAYPDAQSVAWH